MEIRASSLDGHINQTMSDYAFVYEAAELEKWLVNEGVLVKHDTTRNLVIIQVRQCVQPDRKMDRR